MTYGEKSLIALLLVLALLIGTHIFVTSSLERIDLETGTTLLERVYYPEPEYLQARKNAR